MFPCYDFKEKEKIQCSFFVCVFFYRSTIAKNPKNVPKATYSFQENLIDLQNLVITHFVLGIKVKYDLMLSFDSVHECIVLKFHKLHLTNKCN